MFCVDMAPCWRRPLSHACVGGIVPARGVVRTLLTTGTVLESTAGMFLRIRSRYISLIYPLSYIRERIEKYAFIDAQIPNCTINGQSSSTGKTSEPPMVGANLRRLDYEGFVD